MACHRLLATGLQHKQKQEKKGAPNHYIKVTIPLKNNLQQHLLQGKLQQHLPQQ